MSPAGNAYIFPGHCIANRVFAAQQTSTWVNMGKRQYSRLNSQDDRYLLKAFKTLESLKR